MPATTTRPARCLRILSRPREGSLLIEVYDGSVSLYLVSPVEPFSGEGKAWLWQGLAKKSASRYEATADSCDCRGHRRFGYCRHASAVKRLVELGKLPS